MAQIGIDKSKSFSKRGRKLILRSLQNGDLHYLHLGGGHAWSVLKKKPFIITKIIPQWAVVIVVILLGGCSKR